MNEFETHIILLEIGANKDRQDLERIENCYFETVDQVLQELCFDAPVETEKVNIMLLTDFMDACNNMDDDTPIKERIDIDKIWVGYVNIEIK